MRSIVSDAGSIAKMLNRSASLFMSAFFLDSEHKDRLHRLMVAFAIVLRTFCDVVFQLFQRRDHLVGIGASGRLHGKQQRIDAGEAVGAIIGRDCATIRRAEGIVEASAEGMLSSSSQ